MGGKGLNSAGRGGASFWTLTVVSRFSPPELELNRQSAIGYHQICCLLLRWLLQCVSVRDFGHKRQTTSAEQKQKADVDTGRLRSGL